MYTFVGKSKYKECSRKIWPLINNIRAFLKNEIRFTPYLIGSAKYVLATKNGDGPFDMDFTFLITYSNNHDLNYIKNKLINLLQKNYKHFGFNDFKVGSRSIKLKYSLNNKLIHYVEIALHVVDNNGTHYILKLDKNGNQNILNEETDDVKCLDAWFKKFKRDELWDEFRELYLKNKNRHLRNGDKRKSLSVYKETVNEIIQKYY